MAVADGIPALKLVGNETEHPSEAHDNLHTDDLGKGEDIDLSHGGYFENRELSYFKFCLRVLSQASNREHPLLERLMFLLIFSSNLDEFFEIRVSGLKKRLQFDMQKPDPDGKYPEQILQADSRAGARGPQRTIPDPQRGFCFRHWPRKTSASLKRQDWDPLS